MPILAFPNIEPYQYALGIGWLLHFIAVTVLAGRRGHPVWLGLVLGLVPGIGLAMVLLMPVEADLATAEDPGLPKTEERGVMVRLARDRVYALTTRAILVLALIVVFLEFMERPAIRLDLTAEQRYSLDPLTRDALAELKQHKEKLVIRYCYSPSALRPQRLATLPKEMKEMLDEYQRFAPDHVAIQMMEIPQRETKSGGADKSGGLLGSAGGDSAKNEPKTEAELERERVWKWVQQVNLKPISEPVTEGTRRETLQYYSAFYLSYGSVGEAIDKITVSQAESKAGRRVVDQANYLLTLKILELIDRTIVAPQPFRLRAFSSDGGAVRLGGVAGWQGVNAEINDRDGKKWKITGIDAKAKSITVVPLADEDREPRLVRSVLPTQFRIRFVTTTNDDDEQGAAVRRELSELFKRYDVDLLDLKRGGEPIPDDVDVLVICTSGEPMSERLQYEIDQYLMRGGSVLLNYGLMHRPRQQGFGLGAWTPVDDSWATFFGKYGFRIGGSIVFDDECLHYPPDSPQAARLPPVLMLTPKLRTDHPVARGILMVEKSWDETTRLWLYGCDIGSQLTAAGQTKADFRKVFVSSTRAWSQPVVQAILTDPFGFLGQRRLNYNDIMPLFERRASDAVRGQFTLAAEISGEFVSAFADKPIPPKPAPLPETPERPRMPFGIGGPDGQGTPVNTEDHAQTQPQVGLQTQPRLGPLAPPPGTDTGPELVPPVSQPQTQVTPESSANEEAKRLRRSQQPGRIIVFGTNMIYPLSMWPYNSELLISAIEYLANGDSLLNLKSKTTKHRSIDPSIKAETKDSYGWMLTLTAPIALILIWLVGLMFGSQERQIARIQQHWVARSTTATRPERDPALGVVLVFGGLLVAAIIITGWAANPRLSWWWSILLLAVPILVAAGVRVMVRR